MTTLYARADEPPMSGEETIWGAAYAAAHAAWKVAEGPMTTAAFAALRALAREIAEMADAAEALGLNGRGAQQ